MTFEERVDAYVNRTDWDNYEKVFNNLQYNLFMVPDLELFVLSISEEGEMEIIDLTEAIEAGYVITHD